MTGRTAPVSVVELLQRSATAPQLSAVGASTSSDARRVSVGRSGETTEQKATSGFEPVRPTNAALKKGRRRPLGRKLKPYAPRQVRALAGGPSASPQTTRRRVAMHRVAAAAASALNDATPFRTGGSGFSKFSTPSSDTLGSGLDRVGEAVSVIPGLRLENVALSAGYSSNGLPGARSLYSGNLGSDQDFNATATLAYRKRFRSSSFGLTYTPMRSQRMNFTQWNTTDHLLGFNYDRDFGRRWGLAVHGGASNTGLEQFWFRQPVYHRIENPPTTLEELLARSEAGEFTDDEFASLITGAPVVDDPGGRELALTRVTGANTSVAATYAQSARTTYTFGVSGSFYNSNRILSTQAGRGLAVWNVTQQSAFFQSRYRLSPSLSTGFRYNLMNSQSSLGRMLGQTGSAFVEKRLGRSWSVQGSVGGGMVDFSRSNGLIDYTGITKRPTWVADGSVKYRYGGHSFEAFGRRQVGNSMGLNAASTTGTGLSWEWRSPRMPWSFNGTASYSRSDWGFQAIDGSSTAFESSLLQAGLTRTLSPSTAFTTGYYFGRYTSPLRGLFQGTTIHRVQATFLWRPVEPQ
ncbi:MAG: hypothetical protein R2748_12735 [Bryobacterales bacterium]